MYTCTQYTLHIDDGSVVTLDVMLSFDCVSLFVCVFIFFLFSSSSSVSLIFIYAFDTFRSETVASVSLILKYITRSRNQPEKSPSLHSKHFFDLYPMYIYKIHWFDLKFSLFITVSFCSTVVQIKIYVVHFTAIPLIVSGISIVRQFVVTNNNTNNKMYIHFFLLGNFHFETPITS